MINNIYFYNDAFDFVFYLLKRDWFSYFVRLKIKSI